MIEQKTKNRYNFGLKYSDESLHMDENMMRKKASMDKRESEGVEALHLSDRITQDRNHYPQWSPQTNDDNENC